MEASMACGHCTSLSDALGRWEVSLAQGGPHLYAGQAHFLLGTLEHLEVRARDGCSSCRSILRSQDIPALQETHGQDFVVSAHLRTKQPMLYIVWGNLDNVAGNVDAAYRGANFWQLRCGMMMSTNTVLSASSLGRGRVYDRDSYNVALMRRWIEQCDKYHGATCSVNHEAQKFLLPSAKLSYIDVEDRCIVTPADPVRYAALSYVWGPDPVPVATSANIDALRIPGAFSSTGRLQLPATINDAVLLCSWIGIRYLWVDSMCIVQDDMESKMEQIRAMSSVYADAYLTMVALGSEAADSGIPRVTTRPLASHSPFVHLPSQTVIDASQGAIGLSPFHHSRIKWSTRAWTLQEMVFSKRMLGLGPVASWLCRGAQWTEDFEVPSESASQEPAPFEKKPDKPSVAVWPSMGEYSSLAQVYAGRQMTNPEDTLNAFEGIMTPMSQWFPGGFLFGTPEFTFDIGLLWEYRRRGAVPRSGAGWSEEPQQNFPSWSWISYRGRHLDTFWDTDFSYPQPVMTVYPLVKWKKQDRATGLWKDVDNSYHQVRTHMQNPANPTPDGWTKHANGAEPAYYQHYSHGHVNPQPKFSYPIPPFQRLRDISGISTPYHPHLLCESSLARVCFKFLGTADEFEARNEMLLTDASVPEMDMVKPSDGSWVGRIRLNLQPGSSLPKDHEEQEVLAISEASVRLGGERANRWSELQDRPEIQTDGVYRFVNVLWVGWTVEGKVYRKALGRVWRNAWDGLDAKNDTVLLT